MTKPATTLNELIEITRDGEHFYSDAIGQVKSPHLKTVFRAIADAKVQLISALSQHVRAHGEQPSNDRTFAGSFRELYTDVRARLTHEKDVTYVAQLEQSEDRLLHAFQEASEDVNDSGVKQVIAQYLPKVRMCHDQMRNLKMSMMD